MSRQAYHTPEADELDPMSDPAVMRTVADVLQLLIMALQAVQGPAWGERFPIGVDSAIQRAIEETGALFLPEDDAS